MLQGIPFFIMVLVFFVVVDQKHEVSMPRAKRVAKHKVNIARAIWCSYYIVGEIY